ncbi:MAG: hypothetical protein ABI679_05940 [Gemmatimonadota bacterium]
MALTYGRWIAMFAIGASLIAVALLPPPVREGRIAYQNPDMEMRQRYQVQSLLVEAERDLERARISAEIDGLPITAYASPTGAPHVLPMGGPPEAAKDSFAARLGRVWKPVPGDTAIRIGLVLAGGERNMTWPTLYKLPDAGGQQACIVALRTWDWKENQLTDNSLFYQKAASALGPCLLYRMYGHPGPEIERWIRGPGLAYATRIDLQPARRQETIETFPGLLKFEINWSLYSAQASELACLHGAVDQCERAIIGKGVQGNEQPAGGGFLTPPMAWRTPFSGASSGYLSDLRREMGDERFRRFWTSSRPVKEAFQDAFGIPIGQWTQRWISESWSGYRSGPLPRSRTVAFAGGLVVVFLGLALTVSKRK